MSDKHEHKRFSLLKYCMMKKGIDLEQIWLSCITNTITGRLLNLSQLLFGIYTYLNRGKKYYRHVHSLSLCHHRQDHIYTSIISSKKLAIFQHLTNVDRCLHVPEIHDSFFPYCFLLTMTMKAGMWCCKKLSAFFL